MPRWWGVWVGGALALVGATCGCGPATVVAAVAAATAGGGGGGGGAGAGTAPSAAVVVGASGGLVESPEGLRLVVAPGALLDDALITVRPTADVGGSPEPGVALGRAFELGPSGRAFIVPVLATVPIALPTGVEPRAVRVLHASGAGTELLRPDAVHQDSVTVRLRSFSSVQGFLLTSPRPEVDALLPAEGPVAGGADVRILGAHFRADAPGVTVAFGGLPATVTLVTPGEVRARAPARAEAGDVAVVVTNGDGLASQGGPLFTYVAPAAPAAPSGLVAVPLGPTDVELAWRDNAGDEDGFRIERSLPPALVFSVLGIVGANVEGFVDGTAEPATTYAYRVRALGAGGPSGASGTATATTPPRPPVPPSDLVASAPSSDRVELAWTDNATNETSVRIDRRVAGSGLPFAAVGVTEADAVRFTDATVDPATGYDYRVVAVNAGGEAASGIATAATPALGPPLPPTGLQVVAANGARVLLAWTPGGGDPETAFRIERRTGGDPFAPVGAAPAGATGFADATVLPSTAYDYRVVATNGAGDAPPSAVVAATTRPAPTVTSVEPTEGSVGGGTPIVLRGSGFAGAGPVAVSVGGVPASAVVVRSDTEVAAVTPPGAEPGLFAVTLVDLDGAATAPGLFRYLNHVLRFDGGDAVTIAHHPSFAIGRAMTMECWIELDAATTGQVFNKWQVAVEDKHLMLEAARPAVFLAGPDGGLTAPQPIPLGRWTHVAAVLDDHLRLFVDGREVASRPLPGDVKDASGLPGIGLYHRDDQTLASIVGSIDELRISRVARYQGPFRPTARLAADADTVVLYHFDEGAGATTADASGNGNAGTLAPEPARPRWGTEEIVASGVLLEAAVVLPGATVAPGQRGVVVEVALDNAGVHGAAITGADLVVTPSQGVTVTRLDQVRALGPSERAVLVFAVDLADDADLGPVMVDVAVEASDLVNGAPASLPPGQAAVWRVVGWAALGTSADPEGLTGTAGPSRAPAIALDGAEAPLVAWSEGAAGQGEILLRRWDGASWQGLSGSQAGGGVSATPSQDSVRPALAMASLTAPAIAWEERDALGSSEVLLRTWNGSAWVGLGGSGSGGGVSGSAAPSRAPALAIGGDGRPVVAWEEEDGAAGGDIRLRRFDGVAWVEVAGSGSGGGLSATLARSRAPALALTPAGAPIVAWIEDTPAGADVLLRVFDGAVWAELGGSASGGGVSASGGATAVAVRASSTGLPVVAWADASTGTSQVRLRAWDGASWIELAGSGGPGGVSLSPAGALAPALALDAADRPVLAWEEALGAGGAAATSDVEARRWDGAAWIRWPGPASGVSGTGGPSGRPALALDRLGHPVLAWEDGTRDPAAPEVCLRQHGSASVALREGFGTGSSFLARFALHGTAQATGEAIRLTDRRWDEAGSVFYRVPVELASARVRFDFFLDGDADGIALAFLPADATRFVGAGGSGLGVFGLEGLVVEVDIFGGGPSDATENHLALADAKTLAALATADLAAPTLRRTRCTAEVTLDHGRVRVFLESAQAAFPRTLCIDQAAPALTGFGPAFVGFTGGTGLVDARQFIDEVLLVAEE